MAIPSGAAFFVPPGWRTVHGETAGHQVSTVVVGAAQAGAWAQLRPALRRAVSAVQS